MQKLLLTMSMGVAFAVAPFSGHAESRADAFFVNGALGSTHVKVDDLTDKSDIGYSVNAGYRWNDAWGVEVGYVDLGEGKAKDFRIGRGTHDLELATSGWTLGANYKFHFSTNWFGTTRFGAFFSDTKLRTDGTGTQSDTDVNAYVGIGVGYNITEHLGVSVNLDHYWAKPKGVTTGTDKLSMVSAMAEYRF